MRLAGAMVFVALLAGCGGTTGSSLEDAADATAAETSRFELSYRFNEGGTGAKDETFGAAGLFDYPNERGLMTVSGGASFLGEEVLLKEFRLLGNIGYIRWAIKGKSYWVKEDEVVASGDPAEGLIPFPGSRTKPTDVLTRVVLASVKNEEVGKEDVRGTETTHYRAQVDMRKLVQQMPEADRPEGDVEDLWGARFVSVEIWIDGESRLRRITITKPETKEDEAPEMTTTVELFDYGVEVDLEPPPDGELISQEEFDKLTASATDPEVEPSSGEGDLLAPKEVCESAREHLPKKGADRMCKELKENE